MHATLMKQPLSLAEPRIELNFVQRSVTHVWWTRQPLGLAKFNPDQSAECRRTAPTPHNLSDEAIIFQDSLSQSILPETLGPMWLVTHVPNKDHYQ